MKKQTEAYIQNQIWIWFHNMYPTYIIHANTNGIGFNMPASVPVVFHAAIRKSISKAVNLLKLIGLVEGIADLIIWLPNGRAIMVEVKDATGKQSEAQIKIQNKLVKLKGVYLLVRSLEDFQEQIKIYL